MFWFLNIRCNYSHSNQYTWAESKFVSCWPCQNRWTSSQQPPSLWHCPPERMHAPVKQLSQPLRGAAFIPGGNSTFYRKELSTWTKSSFLQGSPVVLSESKAKGNTQLIWAGQKHRQILSPIEELGYPQSVNATWPAKTCPARPGPLHSHVSELVGFYVWPIHRNASCTPPSLGVLAFPVCRK